MIDSQNMIPNTNMQKNYEIIDKFFRAKPQLARPNVADDPLIAQIGNGWDVVNLLMALVRKYQVTGPYQPSVYSSIPIQRTDEGPFRGYASSNMIANLLPLTLKQYVTRQALNNLGDALNEMSSYCREYNNMPVEPRMILALRNRAAHYADMPDNSRYGTPRLSSETEMAVAQLSPYLEKLDKFASTVPLSHLPSEQQAAFVDKIATYYEQRACASIRPERLDILNDTAAFICASRKNDPALRVAVVKAMTHLLQVRPAECGQQVLDYLKRNGGAIRSPGKMRAQIEEVPSATRAALNAYLREVVELYSPPRRRLWPSEALSRVAVAL
jgi:hypothetical protein